MSNNNEIEKPPVAPQISAKDKEAAIALVTGDPVLNKDPWAKYIVNHDGKTPDGKTVGDLGDFLAARKAELEKNPPHLSGGRKTINDVPPSVRGDNPDIWRRGGDKT